MTLACTLRSRLRQLSLAVSVGSAAALALGVAPLAAQADTAVKVGYLPVTGHAKFFVAKEQGFFKKEGLDVDLVEFQNSADGINAVVAGKLDVGAFGTTAPLVFYSKGSDLKIIGGIMGQDAALVVKPELAGTIRSINDLKGKKVAHTSPSSTSGNSAPRALFPGMGVTPEKDYQVLYSGKHDQSIMGVLSGDYDAAPVASDIFHQMAKRGVIKEDDFRIVFTSAKFPVNSLAYAHDLEPGLRDKVVKCVYDYKFDSELSKGMEGATHFTPTRRTGPSCARSAKRRAKPTAGPALKRNGPRKRPLAPRNNDQAIGTPSPSQSSDAFLG